MPDIYVHEKKMRGEAIWEWGCIGLISFVVGLLAGGILGALWQAARVTGM